MEDIEQVKWELDNMLADISAFSMVKILPLAAELASAFETEPSRVSPHKIFWIHRHF